MISSERNYLNVIYIRFIYMASYCNYNNAYNDNNEDLDKMARRINNRKKNLITTVYNDFNRESDELYAGINLAKSMPEFSYFSAQGDYSSPHPTPLSGTLIKDIKRDTIRSSDYESDISSLSGSGFSDSESMQFSIDSPTLDTYIDKAKKDRKNHKHNYIYDLVKKVKHEGNQDTEESIFDHIKKCDQCRAKLIKLIQGSQTGSLSRNKHIFNDPNELKMDPIENDDSMFKTFGGSTKEILIIILIGVFIIIILDLLLRSQKY